MEFAALSELGWNRFFEQQLSAAEIDDYSPVRVAAHFGSRVLCQGVAGESSFPTSQLSRCGEVAVGDWLLIEPNTQRGLRCLERTSLISRKAAGEKVKAQLIAANLDTLFVVASCNHDFNLSRLERYLALASDADVNIVVVLTKSDLCDDPDLLRQQAMQLKSGLIVETVDARDPEQVTSLADWCRHGQTVALVGSSGVGKSTLAMTMGAGSLATQSIREDDSKGRHTTTARCLHRLNAGGLLLDTPGMRELQLADCEEGVAEVVDEIVTLSAQCRFSDCLHQGEPGCAVQAAIDAGELDLRRLKSFAKLQSEQARNARSLREQRHESRKLGKFYKSVQKSKRDRLT